MDYKKFLYKIISFIVAIALGMSLTMFTVFKLIPMLPFVTKCFVTKDPDWGADLPPDALCYVTKKIPVISENYEFGQYILFYDKTGQYLTGVIEQVNENTINVNDSKGNQYTINPMDCIGVITFYIPKIGKYTSESKQ